MVPGSSATAALVKQTLLESFSKAILIFLWKVELIVALMGVITQISMMARHQVKHYNTSLPLSICSHE